MLTSFIDIAETYATKAFAPGELAEQRSGFIWGNKRVPGANPTTALFSSRYPIFSYLSRLEPPPWQEREIFIAEDIDNPWPMVVSWSSREAELGGMNWAERFTHEVFGGITRIELVPDLECADIFVFRSKIPINFGGVLVFVDGEKGPADGDIEDLLAKYLASVVVGPRPAGGLSVFFPVPYASTSFAGRSLHSPAHLMTERRLMVGSNQRRFAAYLAYKCWPHRDLFFRLLGQAAQEHGFAVDALSRCGSSTKTEDERRPMRYGRTYMDDAVELFSKYRFAMVFENHVSPRYVTEKIVNAFLAGCIPIYWGTPYVFRLFNPHAFIYVNGFLSFDDAIRHVINIERDPALYRKYIEAPILRNTSDALRYFSWHRDVADVGDHVPSLREQLVAVVSEMHRKALGDVKAVERRPWTHAALFNGQF